MIIDGHRNSISFVYTPHKESNKFKFGNNTLCFLQNIDDGQWIEIGYNSIYTDFNTNLVFYTNAAVTSGLKYIPDVSLTYMPSDISTLGDVLQFLHIDRVSWEDDNIYGKVVRFDKTNPTQIILGNKRKSLNFKDTESFLFEAIIKPTLSVNSTTEEELFGIWAATPTNGFRIRINGNANSNQRGLGIIYFEEEDGPFIALSSTNYLISNSWQHVGFIWDRENNEARFYINGILSGSYDISNTNINFDYVNQGNGIRRIINNFDGQVALVRLAKGLNKQSDFSNHFYIRDKDGGNVAFPYLFEKDIPTHVFVSWEPGVNISTVCIDHTNGQQNLVNYPVMVSNLNITNLNNVIFETISGKRLDHIIADPGFFVKIPEIKVGEKLYIRAIESNKTTEQSEKEVSDFYFKATLLPNEYGISNNDAYITINTYNNSASSANIPAFSGMYYYEYTIFNNSPSVSPQSSVGYYIFNSGLYNKEPDMGYRLVIREALSPFGYINASGVFGVCIEPQISGNFISSCLNYCIDAGYGTESLFTGSYMEANSYRYYSSESGVISQNVNSGNLENPAVFNTFCFTIDEDGILSVTNLSNGTTVSGIDLYNTVSGITSITGRFGLFTGFYKTYPTVQYDFYFRSDSYLVDFLTYLPYTKYEPIVNIISKINLDSEYKVYLNGTQYA